MEKSKQNYFTKYFESNLKSLKNTWKEIKSIIPLKNSAFSSLNPLNFNNELTSDSLKISNYFSSIRKKLNQK